jgi:DNA-binding IclR family transcriptional regulator
MARIKPLETVERALEVLLALNVLGVSTISNLARFAGLPRAAVNRYVVTFESLGYVYRTPGGTGYRVSSQALELSSGVRTEDWVRRDATPDMEVLSRQIGWPVGLETVRDARLAILTNTDHLSPFVARPVSTRLRLSLVGRASGHVLLSQLDDSLRRDILEAAALDDPNLYKRSGLTPQRLGRILAATRAKGYAVQRVPRVDWTVIAVPVPATPSLVLSLSVRYRNKVVDMDTATRRILPALTATAARISRRLAKSSNDP